MVAKNPFVRMRWLQMVPRLTQHDIGLFQERIRKVYPGMVIFPRRYHFHKLGDEVRKPAFINDMVEHFQPRIDPTSRFGYATGEPIAVRVPWPEEIASGNPQRLIGRPHRKPFQDSSQAFRRFGRTIYIDSGSALCFTGETIDVEPHLLLAHCGSGTHLTRFSVLAECEGCHIELPYDQDDPDVVSFAKSCGSIINRLGSNTLCYSDVATGEPLFLGRGQPVSKSFLKRCALDSGHYLSLGQGTIGGHPIAVGPTPAQRRKWRRESGLDDDTTLQNPPKLSGPEIYRLFRDKLVRYPESVFDELQRRRREALFSYMRAREAKGTDVPATLSP